MRTQTLSLALALTLATPLQGASAQQVNPAFTYTYADLADLAVAAPVAASVRIREAIRLKGPQATAIPIGMARFYVEADIMALIRGAGGLPGQIRYVVDVPLDSRGKPPKLKKAQMLVLARRVTGKPADIQLVAPDAQIAWTPELESRLRAVVQDVAAADAPPAIMKVGSAFHVMGTLPGEGETQIFLITENNLPVSLSILRRPGQQRSWAVALGEIVDEAAGPPQRDTLLWYRLACGGLPRALPAAALRDADPASANAANEDYRFVLDQLGRCDRNREAG